jgi:hypothetical protein
MLAKNLLDHAAYLRKDNKYLRMIAEGHITEKEIENACEERGLSVIYFDNPVLALKDWVYMEQHVRNDASLLLYSMSKFLHRDGSKM